MNFRIVDVKSYGNLLPFVIFRFVWRRGFMVETMVQRSPVSSWLPGFVIWACSAEWRQRHVLDQYPQGGGNEDGAGSGCKRFGFDRG